MISRRDLHFHPGDKVPPYPSKKSKNSRGNVMEFLKSLAEGAWDPFSCRANLLAVNVQDQQHGPSNVSLISLAIPRYAKDTGGSRCCAGEEEKKMKKIRRTWTSPPVVGCTLRGQLQKFWKKENIGISMDQGWENADTRAAYIHTCSEYLQNLSCRLSVPWISICI